MAVADAADGFDHRRVFWLPFDALAQLGDVHVERAGFGEVVHTPAAIEEGVAIDDVAGAFVEPCAD